VISGAFNNKSVHFVGVIIVQLCMFKTMYILWTKNLIWFLVQRICIVFEHTQLYSTIHLLFSLFTQRGWHTSRSSWLFRNSKMRALRLPSEVSSYDTRTESHVFLVRIKAKNLWKIVVNMGGKEGRVTVKYGWND
jgi:hypothetical protein